jgi:VanZ family protein
MGMIYYLSSRSDLALPVELWWSDLLSWLAHFLEFAILAGLLWLAARSTSALSRHAGLIAVAIAALYALSDEVHQSFVPGRVPDVRDWLVDVAGAVLAVWLLSRYRR